MAEHTGDDPHDPGLDLEHAQGERVDPELFGGSLLPDPPELTTETFLRDSVEPITGREIPGILAEVMSAGQFDRGHARRKLTADLIGFVTRRKDGTAATYLETLEEALDKSGKDGTATWGTIELMGNRAVMYALHWDVMGGSVGTQEADLYEESIRAAVKRDLPHVSFWSTGGVRQEEMMVGLHGMRRFVDLTDLHKRQTSRPTIAIPFGHAWGGMTAGPVQRADVIIGLAGSYSGFAGPNVIAQSEGTDPDRERQGVEASYVNRQIEAIANDPDELVTFLGKVISIGASGERERITVRPTSDPDAIRRFRFHGDGLYPILTDESEVIRTGEAEPHDPDATDAYEGYRNLLYRANRVDTEFVAREGFDEFIPLYNAWERDDQMTYPAIIGGIARLDDTEVMLIGNQPSYVLRGDGTIQKRGANPGPKDYAYMKKMYDMAEHLELPVILMTDTAGAKPTIENEYSGQSSGIAEMIARGQSHPYPVMSVVTGMLGSGGGLVTTPFGEHVAMMADAQAYVAEPASAAAIKYRTASPTMEQVRETANSSRATAQDQLELGLADAVIELGNNPFDTAVKIRNHVADVLEAVDTRKLRQRRAARLHAPLAMRSVEAED